MFGVSNLLLVSTLRAASFIYFVFRFIQNRRFYSKLGHLKAIGEASKVFPPKTHHQNLITYLTRKYSLPEIFYLDPRPLAPSQTVIVSGEAAAQITTVRPYPINHNVNTLLVPIIGTNSIATTNGDLRKKLHHILGPAFVPRHIKPLLATMADETLIFREGLKVLANKETFSMEEELSRLLFEIIGKIVFGFLLKAQESGSPILTDLQHLLESFPLTFRSRNYFRKFMIGLKQKAAGARITAYIGDRAKGRFAILKDEKEPAVSRKANSILDRILLDKVEARTVSAKEELDAEYLQVIADNMKTLLVSGFSTTVDTLRYTYTLLSKHPEILKRLREEHDRIFGRDLATTAGTIRQYPSKTDELEYTTAVLKETLRFFPVGSATKENPEGSTALEYKSRRYPTEGQMIMTSLQTIQLDPHNFPNPTTFLPERHLEPNATSTHRTTWRSFERGIRACLGQELATDKMRVILLLTARWFDFEPIVEPAKKQRVDFTNLDLFIGDQVFQQLRMAATPRDGIPMRIKSTGRF